MLKELIEYRELLIAFTWRNIKIKYKQTFMGFLWAVFMPTIIVVSGIMVKNAMAMISGTPVDLLSIVSVSVKALPWSFFIGALKFSVNSLVTNMEILKKIYFPRAIFPLSYIFGQLFDLAIASVALIIFLTIAGLGVSAHLLWVPLLIVCLVLFTAGCGMILSCGNLFYRDVRYIVDVFLTFAIFFTPVFYSADMFQQWEIFLLLNPVGSILECLNAAVVLKQAPETVWLVYACVIAVSVFMGGWFVFHKTEPAFAEHI